MSCYSVPPIATLITCAPRQTPSTGLRLRDERVEQRDLVVVADAIAVPLGPQRLLAVGLGADVGAAHQHEPVELLRVGVERARGSTRAACGRRATES